MLKPSQAARNLYAYFLREVGAAEWVAQDAIDGVDDCDEGIRMIASFEAEVRKDALSGMPTILEDPAGKGYPCFERPMTPTEAKECIDRLSSDLLNARENCAKIADSHDSWVGGEIAAAIRNQEQP